MYLQGKLEIFPFSSLDPVHNSNVNHTWLWHFHYTLTNYEVRTINVLPGTGMKHGTQRTVERRTSVIVLYIEWITRNRTPKYLHYVSLYRRTSQRFTINQVRIHLFLKHTIRGRCVKYITSYSIIFFEQNNVPQVHSNLKKKATLEHTVKTNFHYFKKMHTVFGNNSFRIVSFSFYTISRTMFFFFFHFFIYSRKN